MGVKKINNKIAYTIFIIVVLIAFAALGVSIYGLVGKPEETTGVKIPKTTNEECIYKNGSCCKKNTDICQIVNVTCEPDTYPEIKGCDNNCNVVYGCLQIEKAKTLEIKVYFLPKQSTSQDCSNVSEVIKTIPYTQAVATAAINELLKGPQGSSKAAIETAIPTGTKLLNLYIENGTAYAEFSKEIQNYGGGSCNALAIRAQIENTLKQFPTVDRIEISVPGVVNPLQP